MTVLPSVRGEDLVATLKKAGFEIVRVKGSHHFIRHPDGRTEEVANVIAFLASGAASYVTGTSINLDGGASGVL